MARLVYTGAVHPRGGALWISLAVLAIAPRLVEIAGEPAYLHPDALHQALEPAFRIAYGFSEQTWEWRQGLRSWTWPGVLSSAFAVTRALDLAGPGHGMAIGVALARALTVAIDVAGVLLAARIAAQLCGGWGAVGTVLALSLHPAAVVMGAQPLIDVPAATALVWACERAFATDRFDHRRATMLGVACGTTLVLRLQLAPAVLALLVGAWWRWRPPRSQWSKLALAAAGVVLASGLLDWISWGVPFHSSIAYLRFNLGPGQTAMGEMPADRYLEHFLLAMDAAAPLLLLLGLIGVVRAPALGVVLLAVVVPHQLVSYKVWRFLHPALVLGSVLAVVGASTLIRLAHARDRRLGIAAAGLAAAWFAFGSVRASMHERIWETTWLHNQGGMEAVQASRGLNRAYLELGRRERVEAVVQAVLPPSAAPGLALLGHDATIAHPLAPGGASVGRVGWWIVRDADARHGLRPDARVWSDPDTGVAIYSVR